MSTNIKSIRIVLPATEDRPELDLTDRFTGDDGLGNFDGITAVYDERLTRPWSLEEEPTISNRFPDGVKISDTLGYNIASDVLEYIEEHSGPMTRIESADPYGFVVVFVEDGAIDAHFVAYDERDRVRFEAITNVLGLELTVELLSESEPAEQEDPRAIDSIEGKIRRADGTYTEFLITGNNGYQQWGGTVEQLGETVDMVSAMSDAAREHFPTDEHDDKE